MSTHDYLIDNQTGANFRVDLNNVLSAIVSNNSNATEPTTTFAFMWWADTTAGILKQRNSSNTDWVNILDLTSGAVLSTSTNDLTDAVSDSILLNTALGINAFLNNTTGFGNVVFGNSALKNNTTGNENTAIGGAALFNNLIGLCNVALGHQSLFNNTESFNTAIGKNALEENTTGFENNALGYNAGQNITTGFRNIAIGAWSAQNLTTEECTITMGYNVASLGTTFFTFGEGIGVNRVYNQFSANATWTRASDKRIKKDIETNEDCGLGFINDLRTVTYKFKAPSELDPSLSEYDKDNDKPSHDKPMYGFIAQEVKEVLDNHNIKNFAGWHVDEMGKDKLQGISYEMFVMPLVKSVQELSDKIQELLDEKEVQDDRINRILERLEALENLTK